MGNNVNRIISESNYDNPEKCAEQFESGIYKPRSLIVLLGTWFLMGSLALICVFFVVGVINSVRINGFSELKDNIGEIFIFLFLLAMLFLSIGVLFRITRNYMHKKHK
jgi:ABC-type multidrug transport system permease subunit